LGNQGMGIKLLWKVIIVMIDTVQFYCKLSIIVLVILTWVVKK